MIKTKTEEVARDVNYAILDNNGLNNVKETTEKETTEQKIKKSLRYSVIDGVFYAVMVGHGESFFAAFAIFLKSDDFYIGLLASLPLVLGSLFQLFFNKIFHFFGSRQKFVCIGALAQGLMYIPIMLVFFFGDWIIISLITFVCIYRICGMIIGPAWNSWMGDLVPEKGRGEYFARRSRIIDVASLLSLLSAGYILKQFSDSEAHRTYQYLGFVILFVIACLGRMMSTYYLSRKYEPAYENNSESNFGFFDFLKKEHFKDFRIFVFYLASMNIAVYLAAPYFAPYMLNDLKMSYAVYTIVNATAIVARLLIMPWWGKVSDRFGAKKVLIVCGFFMPMSPALWFISDKLWFILFNQVYSGIVWAGFEISSFNLIFEATRSVHRATCVAYYNVVCGLAIFLGSMIGSALIKYDLFPSKYIWIFLLSGVLRYIVSFIYIPRLKHLKEPASIQRR